MTILAVVPPAEPRWAT